MNNRHKWTVLIPVLLLCGLVFGQDQAKSQTNAESGSQQTSADEKLTSKDYEELLAKLKAGDTSIDFLKLRMAYTETKDFAPYGGGEARKRISDALDQKKYEETLVHVDASLKTAYVDIDAHFSAFIANRELGKTKEAEFHRLVSLGLLDSILENGDGKTAKTAYFVISIREEYFIMSFKGYRVGSQALQNADGHTFDVLTGTNPETNESVSMYFNIDKVFGRF